jgi:kumamolisin
MYIIPDLSEQSVVDAYEAVVSDGLVSVANSSFGGAESGGDTTFAQMAEQLAIQGSAEGITFVAATGDYGASPTGVGAASVEYPASSPHFLAVGGTELALYPNGTWNSEVGWNGSTGGVSSIWPLPAYQAGLAHVITSGRNVPDISLASQGYLNQPNWSAAAQSDAFYFASSWPYELGGTSWSAPIYTALQVETNQRQDHPSGFVNPTLYATYEGLGASGNAGIFHDITIGNNSAWIGHDPGYAAGPGYDQVSGLGSVDGWKLSAYL